MSLYKVNKLRTLTPKEIEILFAKSDDKCASSTDESEISIDFEEASEVERKSLPTRSAVLQTTAVLYR